MSRTINHIPCKRLRSSGFQVLSVLASMGLAFAGSAMAESPVISNSQAGFAGAQAGDWGGHPGAAIGAPDDACANMGAIGKENLVSNFGFDIPTDVSFVQFTGIAAYIKSGQEGADQEITVQLASDASAKPGITLGSSRTFTVPGEANGNCTSTEVRTLGDPNSLTGWGDLSGLTPAMVNSSDFGLKLTTATKASVKIDSICLRISYETDAGVQVTESCTPPAQVGNTITVVKNLASGSATPGSDWGYNGTGDLGGGFTLPAAGGSKVFTELADGSYTITETTKQGYNVSVQCLMGETVIASGVNSVDVNVSGNQSVSCVFTNWIPDTGGPGGTGVSFDVYKSWDDSTVPPDTPVQVQLLCSSGDRLNQTTTVSEAQHAHFTIQGIADPTTCTISETVPAGYTASYDARVCGSGNCSDTNSTSCSFENVFDDNYQGGHECDITNTPDSASVTITKTWVIPEGNGGFDGGYRIKLDCDGADGVCGPQGCDGEKAEVHGDGNADPAQTVYEFTVGLPAYQGMCKIKEEANDSLVEIDMSDCVPKDGKVHKDRKDNEVSVKDIPVGPGDEFACEIVNTVFFEGIPTLNRYGMAMLALLMLGVGLVGFRRLV